MAGLAALAGINMGKSGGDVNFLDYVDILVKDPYFLDPLINEKWVITRVQSKKERKERAPITYDTVTLAQFWELDEPDTTVPNWEYRYLHNQYSMLRNPKNGFISVSNSDGVLTISTKFTNPDISYQVHYKLIELLRTYFKDEYRSKDQKKLEFIEGRVEEVSAELHKAENRLVYFSEKNIIATSPKVLLKGERLKREVELQAGVYSELVKQRELAKIDAKKETPVFESIQKGEFPLGPSEPNRKLLMVIGFILGGAVGVFLVFAIEWIKSFKGDSNKIELSKAL